MLSHLTAHTILDARDGPGRPGQIFKKDRPASGPNILYDTNQF